MTTASYKVNGQTNQGYVGDESSKSETVERNRENASSVAINGK